MSSLSRQTRFQKKKKRHHIHRHVESLPPDAGTHTCLLVLSLLALLVYKSTNTVEAFPPDAAMHIFFYFFT